MTRDLIESFTLAFALLVAALVLGYATKVKPADVKAVPPPVPVESPAAP